MIHTVVDAVALPFCDTTLLRAIVTIFSPHTGSVEPFETLGLVPQTAPTPDLMLHTW